MALKSVKTIGILTGGGDCPGLNGVIRAAVKTAEKKYNVRCIGIIDGFDGLMKKKIMVLNDHNASGILHRGGTILGTSNRANPFLYPVKKGGETVLADVSDKAIRYTKQLGIDALMVIGGDGTLSIAYELFKKGVKCVGVPKTIDNDLSATDVTFGFDTAVTTATEAIDKLTTTAESHHRIMVLEVMGRYAGWIALKCGIAGGGDVILIPEIPFEIEKVALATIKRREHGKPFSIVIVAEGAKEKGKEMVVSRIVKDSTDPVRLGGIGYVIGQKLEALTGMETRVTVLGHLQRGGVPTSFDRILSTRFGSRAMDMIMEGKFGYMAALRTPRIVPVEIKKAVKKLRRVPLTGEDVMVAKSIGVSFGDK